MKFIFLTALILTTYFGIVAQSSDSMNRSRKWLSSINVIDAYRFQDRTEFSRLGFEYQLNHTGSSKIGFQLSFSYFYFNRMDFTSIPLMIGAHYHLNDSDKYAFRVLFKVGPSAGIGNDYASIFIATETGLQISTLNHKGLIANISWANTLAFHPSHFAFIKAGIGYVF